MTMIILMMMVMMLTMEIEISQTKKMDGITIRQSGRRRGVLLKIAFWNWLEKVLLYRRHINHTKPSDERTTAPNGYASTNEQSINTYRNKISDKTFLNNKKNVFIFSRKNKTSKWPIPFFSVYWKKYQRKNTYT